MTIFLATDHAGFELKEKIKHTLIGKGYQVEDCGAFEYDSGDDYPDTISKAAEKISEHPTDRAIVFGSSGQGEAIVANKFRNVRAVVFYGPYVPQNSIDVSGKTSNDPFEVVRLARVHNDANILSLGAHILSSEDASNAVDIFLQTDFSNEERHTRRIEKITLLESHA